MFELLYNFNGLNQKIFLYINHATNIGMLPEALKPLSWCFNLSNFAVFYLIYIIYVLKTIIIDKAIFSSLIKLKNIFKIGILYSLFGVIFTILKYCVNLPRPFCSLPEGTFITILDTNLARCLSSFPSSHSGMSLLIAYILWPNLNKFQKILAVLVVIIECISRITHAMHYPSDILYGLLITSLIILAGNHIYNYILNKIMAKFMKHLIRF
jgi:membrane-associated phospholipid phosphatase